MPAMEAISLNQYILFVHSTFRKITESEFLTFRSALFYNFMLIAGFYLGFKGLIERFYIKLERRRSIKLGQNIRFVWNICFCFSMIIFLKLYHEEFISPEFERESHQLFPAFTNSLFFKVCDMNKFKLITLLLTSFYSLEAFIDLNEQSYSNSGRKLLFAVILLVCYDLRFENYSVMLNIFYGLYNMIINLVGAAALNSKDSSIVQLSILTAIRFLAWIYVFINILPFDFLIPTLHASKFNFTLNLLMWWWYVISVWDSPFLRYFYHTTYHFTGDCVGETSTFKCILFDDTPDQKHLRVMRRIWLEEQKRREQSKLISQINEGDSPSNKAFQTIKCIMTLKRKLRRIRSNVQNNLKEANVTMPSASSTFSINSPDALNQNLLANDDDDEDEDVSAS